MSTQEELEKALRHYKKLRDFNKRLNELEERHYDKTIDELEQQLEPEITEGQYFERSGAIYRVMDILDGNAWPYHVKRVAGDKDMPYIDQYNDDIMAYGILSDKEVEQALIKEAKRRGFDDAEKWRTTWNDNDKSLKPFSGKRYEYSKISDSLFLGGVRLYKQGHWAEIIEDEWEAKVHQGRYYYVSNGSRVIKGEQESISQQEAETIKNALNNLDND